MNPNSHTADALREILATCADPLNRACEEYAKLERELAKANERLSQAMRNHGEQLMALHAQRSEIDAQEIRKKAILDCANMVMGRLAGRQEGSDLWLEICKIANMLRREGDIEKLSAPCVARRAVEEIKAIIQKHVPLPGWAYEDEIVRVVRECERPGE